jgi:TrmH family RNA methyltransferase
VTVLRSRDNGRVKRWRKLASEPRFRREERRAMIEGTRLLAEYLDRAGPPCAVLAAESAVERPEVAALVRRSGLAPVVLADGVFRAIADTESPAGVAAEIGIPDTRTDLAASPLCVLLEGIQDAGNVGTILRSAAAFGASDAVLSPGCADAWSPKALRAAMGGHFRLAITQDADLTSALSAFRGPTVSTVPRGGTPLHQADLSGRIAWIFGAEGRGVSDALSARVPLRVSIPMPGGAESLNVGSAAAICLYETFRQRAHAAIPPG